jgi:hypothetical protein
VARVIGLHSRTGSAEAVVISDRNGSPAFLGRWSLDLLDGRVERQIFHVVADVALVDAERQVRRVVDAITEIATTRLDGIRREVGPLDAAGVIVGDYPVPDSLAAILAAHTLMHAAEGAMFRDALLDAATTHGIRAVGVSRNRATDRLAGDLAAAVAAIGAAAGRPWRKEQKLATVAALTVAGA